MSEVRGNTYGVPLFRPYTVATAMNKGEAMRTGLEFIPLTVMIGIVGWFGWAALSGSRALFKEKKYFAALCALFLAAIWITTVAVLVSQVFIAWIIVGVIGCSALVFMALDDEMKRALKGIFGWCCILFVFAALWLLFTR